MKLIQMIIVTSTYLAAILAIMVFIQGFVYQVFGFSIWNWLMSLGHETVDQVNNRRKLRYTKFKKYKKVG